MLLRKSIAIDMDGVLADTDLHFIAWYFDQYGVKIPYHDLIGKPEGEGFPEKDAIFRFVNTPGFFRTLPVMKGATTAVLELMGNYEIYIVSAAMQFPQSLLEKKEWLQEHFPFINWRNIVFCGAKNIIKADFMIDDHCHNLDSFQGDTFLFNAAHNVNVTHHKRVCSWKEILTLL